MNAQADSRPALTVAEMMTRQAEPYNTWQASLTPAEKAAWDEDFMERLTRRIVADLKATNATACALCGRRRPRVTTDEPTLYAPIQCASIREPWHYPRAWSKRPSDLREGRRHRRRVRKGRLPHARPVSGGAT